MSILQDTSEKGNSPPYVQWHAKDVIKEGPFQEFFEFPESLFCSGYVNFTIETRIALGRSYVDAAIENGGFRFEVHYQCLEEVLSDTGVSKKDYSRIVDGIGRRLAEIDKEKRSNRQ